ncbi:MAG: DNA repair protein RadC [Clostridiales bacterium]|nr:DNA repair protein RadC [Clostridiales bacterium]
MSSSKYNIGHRQRLRQRYINGGIDAFHDYEILELLLTYAIPRIDVKPIAKELIIKFGNLDNVFAATPKQLQEVKGIGEHSAVLISLVSACNARIHQNRSRQISQIGGTFDAEIYFRNYLYGEHVKKLAVMCLDNSNKILTCKIVAVGSVSYTEINARKIVELVMANNASKVVIAHNHPFGRARPSEEDIGFTIAMNSLLSSMGIKFYDHIIVGQDDTLSMGNSLKFVKYFS